MKILITGARGYLASFLIPVLQKDHEIFLTSLHSDRMISGFSIIPLDLSDFVLISKLIKEINPDLIINTAAISLPDWAEINKEKTYAANVIAVGNLVKICSSQDPKIKLVQISTDYVFSGENAPYSEESKPNPVNYYGQTKLEAEKIILEAYKLRKLEHFLICRTTILYGLTKPFHRGNFFINTYKTLKEHQNVVASTSNITCPTHVKDLALCLKFLIKNNKSGIYHTAGPESVSRFEFAKKITQIFGFDPSNIIPSKYHTQKAQRPKNSTLDTSKLKKVLPFKMKKIEEALLTIKKEKSRSYKLKNPKI